MSELEDRIVPQIRQQRRLRFDFLGGIFPGKNIAPTDIDNMFEHCGHFLFFEFKQPGEDMPQGQEIALRKLLQLNPDKVMILEVEGVPPEEVHRYRWLAASGVWKLRDWLPGNELVVRELVRHWWDWVEQTEGR